MKNNTKRLVLSALFCALIAIFSQIIIPLPSGIPFTLQTLAVALCGFYLGPIYSLLSIGVYILLGAVGLPVFSGFLGGAGVLFGKTGGFIIGFVFLSLLCALSLKAQRKTVSIFLLIFSVILCHLFGILHISLIYKTPFLENFLIFSLPFLIKDYIFVFAAKKICSTIKKRFN